MQLDVANEVTGFRKCSICEWWRCSVVVSKRADAMANGTGVSKQSRRAGYAGSHLFDQLDSHIACMHVDHNQSRQCLALQLAELATDLHKHCHPKNVQSEQRGGMARHSHKTAVLHREKFKSSSKTRDNMQMVMHLLHYAGHITVANYVLKQAPSLCSLTLFTTFISSSVH